MRLFPWYIKLYKLDNLTDLIKRMSISEGLDRWVDDFTNINEDMVVGPKQIYFDVFDILSYFREDICIALPYFHLLMGCNMTSSFYQLVKAKFWKTWMKQHNNNERLTRISVCLGVQPTSIDPNDVDKLQGRKMMNYDFFCMNNYGIGLDFFLK